MRWQPSDVGQQHFGIQARRFGALLAEELGRPVEQPPMVQVVLASMLQSGVKGNVLRLARNHDWTKIELFPTPAGHFDPKLEPVPR